MTRLNLQPTPTPVAVTETFSGTLNVNGARTHSFAVDRAGTVSAQIKTLSDQAATIGVSLGTWNGVGLHDHHQQYRRGPQHHGHRHRPINRAILRLAQRCRQAHRRRRLLRRRHALLKRVWTTGAADVRPSSIEQTRPRQSRSRSERRPHCKSEDWSPSPAAGCCPALLRATDSTRRSTGTARSRPA